MKLIAIIWLLMAGAAWAQPIPPPGPPANPHFTAYGLNAASNATSISTGNTAIGVNALAGGSATTGTNNTAVGDYALGTVQGDQGDPGNPMAHDNTAIGYHAGANINTGTGNICVGENCPITSGNDNLCIGNNLTHLVDTESNQIDIADTIVGAIGGPMDIKGGMTGLTITQKSPPANLQVSHSSDATEGTSQWCYVVTAVTVTGGETLPSDEACDTTGDVLATTPESLSWEDVPGAVSYKVYGNTIGSELFMASVTSGRTFTDDGSITPDPTGTLPTKNSTGNLRISDGGASAQPPLNGASIIIDSNLNSQRAFTASVAAAGGGPTMTLRSAHGAIGAETVTLSGDRLGALRYDGHDGVDYQSGAQIWGSATQDWSVGKNGSKLDFFTNPDDSASQVKAVEIGQNQALVSYGGVVPPIGAIGALPTCSSATEGVHAVATDCNAPCGAAATCTTGGSTHCEMYCGPSGYVETGVN